VRLSRCEVRVHINDRDHRRLYLFYGALQRLKPPTRYICELFGAPRFSSFSTLSANTGLTCSSKQHHESTLARLICAVLIGRRLLERSDLTSTIKCSCHFPVIFEKRIVALKLLQCSLRKTNTEGGFVRGGPKSNSISACWLGGGVRFHVE
jgi:hypothetical protein